MVTAEKRQIGLDDNMVQNAELEKVLEEREELKGSAAEYRKKNKEAKELINSLVNPAYPMRIGRFLINMSTVPGKSVEFTTEESKRLSIKVATE